MNRGISKSCIDLDRSGKMYNVTPYFEAHTLFFKRVYIFIVPSDLGPKVKVMNFFF